MPQTRATRASRRAVAADPRSALQARLRSGRSRAATACPTAGPSERVGGPGRSRLRTLPTRGPPSSQHEAADLTPFTGAGYGSFPRGTPRAGGAMTARHRPEMPRMGAYAPGDCGLPPTDHGRARVPRRALASRGRARAGARRPRRTGHARGGRPASGPPHRAREVKVFGAVQRHHPEQLVGDPIG